MHIILHGNYLNIIVSAHMIFIHPLGDNYGIVVDTVLDQIC